jgi:hypothetical protein
MKTEEIQRVSSTVQLHYFYIQTGDRKPVHNSLNSEPFLNRYTALRELYDLWFNLTASSLSHFNISEFLYHTARFSRSR